jgi:hypothetical protein
MLTSMPQPAGWIEHAAAASTPGKLETCRHGSSLASWKLAATGALTGKLKTYRHGEGRYRWPDGATYEGGWVRGKLHGKGTYTSALGLLFSGTFVSGLFQQTPTSLVAVR